MALESQWIHSYIGKSRVKPSLFFCDKCYYLWLTRVISSSYCRLMPSLF